MMNSVLAAAAALMGIAGAAMFAWAGLGMVLLRSVDGGTVAEAFDNLMGFFSLGMAALCLLVAFTAAVRLAAVGLAVCSLAVAVAFALLALGAVR